MGEVKEERWLLTAAARDGVETTCALWQRTAQVFPPLGRQSVPATPDWLVPLT